MEDLRRDAAYAAVDSCVEGDMIVGLGTGATASWAVRRIGGLLSSGDLHDVWGIPTSEKTAELAQEVGVPLTSLSEATPRLTIDGADEIDPGLALIKGRGGALLREKIVAASGNGLIVVADGSKVVDMLGGGSLPVEVEPFGFQATMKALFSLGCEPGLRMAGTEPFLTDGGHYTVDCLFASIPDPQALEDEIRRIPGAIESGLFVGLARKAFVAREVGVEVIEAW